ncbi:MAG: LegC family aminotransferase [Mucilaginibacter polytrichastri]|nr:LegC family aminotransferase [Mucilaginibacter polytrichastri]
MDESVFQPAVDLIRSLYPGEDFIPLHRPFFGGREKQYVAETIDSTYVSSVGEFVNRFEKEIAGFTGAQYAVAVVNGTSALHISLLVAGVRQNDEVLSQALTFIATANAISYIGAKPVFIDVDRDTMGMSPAALNAFLQANAEIRADGHCYNKHSEKRISACVPMHTFGFPLRIDQIRSVCDNWNITLVEDAAESLGSYYKSRHTGTFGKIGVFSFNGNKTITCGGGGAIITDDASVAHRLKHLTTQAKQPHKWEFVHDAVGYNYRMPNLNAALACAQLEQLDAFVAGKRSVASRYKAFFTTQNHVTFAEEIAGAKANYWLNTLVLDSRDMRDDFLEFSNSRGVMTRPAWQLMNRLAMFSDCEHDGLENSRFLADRIVNIPSSYTNAR